MGSNNFWADILTFQKTRQTLYATHKDNRQIGLNYQAGKLKKASLALELFCERLSLAFARFLLYFFRCVTEHDHSGRTFS